MAFGNIYGYASFSILFEEILIDIIIAFLLTRYSEGKKYPKPELCRKHETVLLIDDSLKYAKECSSHGIPVSFIPY